MPRINPLDPDISHQNQIREWYISEWSLTKSQ